MTDMIERVAQTICDFVVDIPRSPDAFTRVLARSIITAMRVPTQGMVDAAYAKERAIFGPHPHANMNISTAWEAMIDAALSPPNVE